MLEFDGLYKAYGSNQVLEGVGFTVAPGQMFGFCGSNGAGKTTTMRIAMGLARADAGQVRWSGRPVDEAVRRRIGYMPEERGLYPKMKVGEQLTYFARLHGLSGGAAARAAATWAERLGIGERRNDAVEKLSLGNQQRVQLAAALVSEPDVRVESELAGDTLLELAPGADDQAVLAAALRTGRVAHFAWREPSLVELFREAVAEPAQGQARPQEVAA